VLSNSGAAIRDAKAKLSPEPPEERGYFVMYNWRGRMCRELARREERCPTPNNRRRCR
jgi:hypothetical protein